MVEPPPSVGMMAIGRPTFDLESAAPATETAFLELQGLAQTMAGDDTIRTTADEIATAIRQWPSTVHVIVVAFATFADSTLAAAAVAGLADRQDLQVILWSFPEPQVGGRLRWNSMCGSILAAFRLVSEGIKVRSLHRSPGDPGTAARLAAVVDGPRADIGQRHDRPFDRPTAEEKEEVERVVGELTRARIGVVGVPPEGFEPCQLMVDPSPIGATFEVADLDLLFSTARSGRHAADDGKAVVVRESVGRLDNIEHRDQAAVEQSMQLHDALRTLSREREWDGVAVRCWPECFTQWKGAACAPLSLLADSGLPTACEADAYGALTCLLLSTVAHSPAFLTDLVDIDPDENTATFWHCGMAPRSLADQTRPVVAIDHPNRGIPLAFDFGLASGQVTIARISQSGGELRLIIGHGEAMDRPRPFTGTSGVVALQTPVADVFELITEEGLEHHFVLVPGHHQKVLAAIAERWAIPVVRLTC